ncbi:MAG TPA: hypothetical protein VGU43_05190 [Thermoplasmata archaeon]|nr:hypothetical protein [Thermoplasmata archaeon]
MEDLKDLTLWDVVTIAASVLFVVALFATIAFAKVPGLAPWLIASLALTLLVSVGTKAYSAWDVHEV